MELNIKKNVGLKSFTTFRIGGEAKFFFKPKNKKEFILAFKWAKDRKIPIFLLGGGSNILISDNGFNGLVIKLDINKINKVFENKNKQKIRVGAGLPLSKVLSYCLKNNLKGMAWSVGIPGTVGGAVFGNAGAHGRDIGDFVLKAEVFSNDNMEMVDCDNKFSYRNSYFKENNLKILNIILEFKKGIDLEDKNNFKKWQLQKGKLPSYMTAGSVFKNVALKDFSKIIIDKFPDLNNFEDRVPTGWIIDQCGLKGKKIGDAIISNIHANYIVNSGNATSSDVMALIELAKKSVKEKFGIVLKEEIQYIL